MCGGNPLNITYSGIKKAISEGREGALEEIPFDHAKTLSELWSDFPNYLTSHLAQEWMDLTMVPETLLICGKIDLYFKSLSVRQDMQNVCEQLKG